MNNISQTLESLWLNADNNPEFLNQVRISAADSVLPSSYKVTTAAAASIASTALMAATLWQTKSGHKQTVTIDTRRVNAAFRSERYLRLNQQPHKALWDPIAGFYQTGDGRWVQLHTNFPHHRQGVITMLDCADNREAVNTALQNWHGQAVEDHLAEHGLVGSLVRTTEEWASHPQSRAITQSPLFEIIKLDDSPARALPEGPRPLSNIRVLDLTRIIAGPICGRNLAEHGAEVLHIRAPHLPHIEVLVMDTGRGKRSTFLDLRHSQAKQTMHKLLAKADIFVQGYRPGGLAELGFSPQQLAAQYPGLIYVSLSAYSHAGPWANRHGYDSLVQSASGIAWEEGQAAGLDKPQHLPAQALDHATGYIAAYAAMVALQRRAEEGGSWLVRISLAQTGHWCTGLGRSEDINQPDLSYDDISDLLQTSSTPFGEITHVMPGAELSTTPAYWRLPAVPLGTHAASWN